MGIDPIVHPGYRVALRGGRWVCAGMLTASTGKKRLRLLTMRWTRTACVFLSSKQSARHEDWSRQSIEAVSKAAGDPVTVRSVTEAYILEREKVERARGARLDAGNRMRKHILSDAAIADKELHCLTEADLQDWRGRLPADFARATVLRVNNDFKAALNAGVSKHAAASILDASHIGVVVKNGFLRRMRFPPLPEIRSYARRTRTPPVGSGCPAQFIYRATSRA